MGAINFRDIFTVGLDVIGSELKGKDKTVILRLGDAANQVQEAEAEVWGPFGIASMPAIADPKDPNGAAQTLCINTSSYHLMIGGRDSRTNKLYGQLSPGDTALYCSGQGRVLLKKNGGVNLFTRKGNTDTGKGMGIFIDPDLDQISIVNSAGYGILIKSDGVMITAKDSGLTLNSSGSAMLVAKQTVTVDGGSVILGANPAAVPGLFSALFGVTGLSGVASTKVLIGA